MNNQREGSYSKELYWQMLELEKKNKNHYTLVHEFVVQDVCITFNY